MTINRRQGLHVRNGRVSGTQERLSSDSVKLLAAVKFGRESMTREDLEDATSLSEEAVVRNASLLLRLGLIKQHSLFPRFPAVGWRVYTDPLEHDKIIVLLRAHGYQDPDSSRTRDSLGGYYPTGMFLEGRGLQPDRGRGYPPLVPVNEDLSFRPETLTLLREWRDVKKPFLPKDYSLSAVDAKLAKFRWLAAGLARIYDIRVPRVEVGVIDAVTWSEPGSSGSSNYSRAGHVIIVDGKFSVVTFLHEFGHARGFDETDAVLWSVNVFKRVFPKSFARAGRDSHLLVRGDATPLFGS